MNVVTHIAAVAALTVLGCAPVADDFYSDDDRRDGEADRQSLLAALADHHDPVADFLRQQASESATVAGDFTTIVDAVGETLGCGATGEQTFVVLTNEGLLPKTVVTRCAGSSRDASQFFVALPALADDGDLDLQFAHVSAWDDTAKRYRTYSVYPDATGDMRFNVEPRFCLGCHGGPEGLDYWTPLMNEMQNPWTQWHAQPDFPSQSFDEFLNPVLSEAARFQAVTGDAASASKLEPIIRAGIDRVTEERLSRRMGPVSLEEALTLVRPLFCDESINFVSEKHGTGQVPTAAVIDPTIRDLFAAAGGDWQYGWYRNDAIVLPTAPVGSPGLTLIATRGEATRQIELGLVARRVVTPTDALRVRAIDWQRPVASTFRCSLYRNGEERLTSGLSTIDTSAAENSGDILGQVIDELLTVGGVRLAPVQGDVISLANAEDVEAVAALLSGNFANRDLTLAQFGDALESYTSNVTRAIIDGERRLRGCQASARFPLTPLFLDYTCD